MKVATPFVLAGLVAGCALWQPEPPPEAAVRGALEALGAAERAGAVPLILGVFADDAVLVPASGRAVEGLPAIADHYRLLVAEQKLDTTLVVEHVRAGGEIAWAAGRTTGYLQSRKTGGERRIDDRWLAVLEREAGEWRIARFFARPASD